MEKNRYKKRISGPVVGISIIIGIIVFVNIWGAVISGLTGTESKMPRVGNVIDTIYVQGTIAEGEMNYNHAWTINRINELMYDKQNKGIFLYVNSPGGGIYESDELYLKLKEYKEVTERPVYAYMAQTAASGGLYVCMAADKIYANRMTMTGSIGVIMSMTDTTGLQELLGIKTENIVSGENKAMGNPLTDEQRQILQTMIDESYNIFVDVVAENRSLTEAKVKELADGRVYSALQAKDLGLIDEVGSVEDAMHAMMSENQLESCGWYSEDAPTVGLLDMLLGAKTESKDLLSQFSEIQKYIEVNKTPRLMYYYGN
ncbi:signal peptide peptidase SppA [Cellulosilyticum lentocellum]|uniref:Signal peptide peptidase SppA, 36K type n=1 Tax=Cellulosilyticum lentocellum (strain ATCC 49066 / DSM 5427 / NCIMB 11756 / RHM5) TaxID=642492 RepID=F2JPF5_CELLD|nr:signal peptide peptidase SppA [Cellulosilyticum lentocellum]ADZ82503.1 signal peptide peptidase SppA, 36K type [Cellulosilyticum lentocellum DSM 5427]